MLALDGSPFVGPRRSVLETVAAEPTPSPSPSSSSFSLALFNFFYCQNRERVCSSRYRLVCSLSAGRAENETKASLFGYPLLLVAAYRLCFCSRRFVAGGCVGAGREQAASSSPLMGGHRQTDQVRFALVCCRTYAYVASVFRLLVTGMAGGESTGALARKRIRLSCCYGAHMDVVVPYSRYW